MALKVISTILAFLLSHSRRKLHFPLEVLVRPRLWNPLMFFVLWVSPERYIYFTAKSLIRCG